MARHIDQTLLRSAPDLSFEKNLWRSGVQHVAGMDEAGRGALAGPVAAAALILPADRSVLKTLHGVRDSKELTPAARASWAHCLHQVGLAWGVGFASHQEIDALGILPATRLAAQRALDELALPPQHLLLDYLFLPDCPLPQTALIKGDTRSLSIAGASILAKTARDALLCEMDRIYPGYGFASHKGYGTPGHLKALADLGPCPIHRLTFTPIKEQGIRKRG